MIAMVNEILTKQGVGTIESWSGTDTIPRPGSGCADEQVPDFTPVFKNPRPQPADKRRVASDKG